MTIYSYDVFNTCLSRHYVLPTDLFQDLWHSACRAQSNQSHACESIYEFSRQRIQTEQIAREQAPQEDISLIEIYQMLKPWLVSLQYEPQLLMELEIQHEINSVFPVRTIQQQVQQRRQQGDRIIFISDMYLPTWVVQKMLLMHDIAEDDDPVYVSGDIGLTKASGNLFRYVLEKEGLTPSQLHHIGDNLHSDVLVPKQLGIQATYFKGGTANRYEQGFRAELADVPSVESKILGLSRAIRLKHSYDTQANDIARLGADIVAPLLISYVIWVIQQANQLGLQRLYFVARDGQILWKIAQAVADYMPTPECHYLYGSRQAWFLPAVDSDADVTTLDWLLLPGHSSSPRHLLHKLHLTPSEVADSLISHGFTPETWDYQMASDARERFLTVLRSPTVQSAIRDRVAKTRDVTQQYFAQEGLTDDIPWAIVDMGWTLKTQRTLSQLLDRPVRGFYFGILRDALTTPEAGHYQAFLMEPATPNPVMEGTEYLFRYMSVLEQVFTAADHGTTLGYRHNGQVVEPILKTAEPNRKFLDPLHAVVLDYAIALAQHPDLVDHIAALKRFAISNTVQFFAHPEAADAQVIAQFLHGDDQNESRQRPIARPLGLHDLIYFGKRVLKAPAREFSQGFEWREGSVALSAPWLRVITQRALQTRRHLILRRPLWVYRILAKIRRQ